MGNILLIDGNNMLKRSYSAKADIGSAYFKVNGIYYFFNSLNSLIRKFKPIDVRIFWDGFDAGYYKHLIYPNYKANRKSKSWTTYIKYDPNYEIEKETFKWQKERLFEYFQIMNIGNIEIPFLEADDLISFYKIVYSKNKLYTNNINLNDDLNNLTSKYGLCVFDKIKVEGEVKLIYDKIKNEINNIVNKKHKLIICSSDNDFRQLIDQNTSLYSLKNSISIEYDNYMGSNPKHSNGNFKLNPYNLSFIKVINGDKSDNIKALKGIKSKFNSTISSLDLISLYNEDTFFQEFTKDKYLFSSNLIKEEKTYRKNFKIMSLHTPIMKLDEEIKVITFFNTEYKPNFNLEVGRLMANDGVAALINKKTDLKKFFEGYDKIRQPKSGQIRVINDRKKPLELNYTYNVDKNITLFEDIEQKLKNKEELARNLMNDLYRNTISTGLDIIYFTNKGKEVALIIKKILEEKI